ncbi:MAG TPA: hypothetical protein VMF58_13205 [Rhizomicrobium sp.]|nr:hypothetical protein [Rhizomicrobium sp.]
MFRPIRAKSKAKAQRAGAGRLAITLFTLLAFTFQSFVAQVHIHIKPWTVSTTLDAGKAAQPGKPPANDDQTSCPICQVILHAGQFVTPSAIAFALPSFALFFVAAANDPAPPAQTASHGWQSRAPPRI